MATPRLITRALALAIGMEAMRDRQGGRRRIVGYYASERRHRELVRILTDLDARESVVQPNRRKAHGLKPKRR